jgi:hypothetical protein
MHWTDYTELEIGPDRALLTVKGKTTLRPYTYTFSGFHVHG